MRVLQTRLKLLGLSEKEIQVLEALRRGRNTPARISKEIQISRPTIYEILERLQRRGLVQRNIKKGKRYWSQAGVHDLEQRLYEAKRGLLALDEGQEETPGILDSRVVIHRGARAIRVLIGNILKENKNRRLYGIQGDTVTNGWNTIFGTEETGELNRLIKSQKIIVEAITPYGWFADHIKLLGTKWAQNFEGRMSVAHEIDPKYFNHGAQMFVFKNSLYLIAMDEEIVAEIKNSEIQKMILALFRFIQDNANAFDVNARLRTLLDRK